MKTIFLSCMRRAFFLCAACCIVIGMNAAPADPSWQQQTQTDGSTITVRLVGDEYAHFWATEDGKLAIRHEDGRFERTEQTIPTPEQFAFRRAQARARRTSVPHAKKLVVPNLAPRGVVILVNFSDSKMDEAHTREVFDDMCNSTNCTTNTHNGKNYGSAAQYFADQSFGAYRPAFDVFGPITLSHPVAYYGENRLIDGSEFDGYMADFVIESVAAAYELGGIDFSKYDANNDGDVDFIYFIYAGLGEAAGGAPETIWPHNAYLNEMLYYGSTHGGTEYYCNDEGENIPIYNGKRIHNYACSAELYSDQTLGGIGTLCHEFGHVIGLPDFYDTENSANPYTPHKYDVMASGNYNGRMHCPPYYTPWERAFFGWAEPVNLGNESSLDTLYTNGTGRYNIFQINASGKLQSPTMEHAGVCLYLENRQQTGWDEYLPSHGLAVWWTNYDETAWDENTVNNMTGDNWKTMHYVLSNMAQDECRRIPAKPVTEVKEDENGVISFRYMDEAAIPTTIDYEPRWDQWAFYCDSTHVEEIGSEVLPFYWGVMFPAATLANDTLTVVSLYELAERNTQPITIDIYNGGTLPVELNKLYTETVDPAGADGWHEITLQKPVIFNRWENLWVILNEGTDETPAIVCLDKSGDPNGRWIKMADTWQDLGELLPDAYAFMINAGFGNGVIRNTASATEEITVPASSRKILRDGQLLIRKDECTYTILGIPFGH